MTSELLPCAPNTFPNSSHGPGCGEPRNKPQHLAHVRPVLRGWLGSGSCTAGCLGILRRVYFPRGKTIPWQHRSSRRCLPAVCCFVVVFCLWFFLNKHSFKLRPTQQGYAVDRRWRGPASPAPAARPGPAGGFCQSSLRPEAGPRLRSPSAAAPRFPPSRCPAERGPLGPSAARSPAAARRGPATPAPPSLTACSTPPSCPGRCPRRRQVEPPALPRPQIPHGRNAALPRQPRRLPPHRAAVPFQKGSRERAERAGGGGRVFF